MRLLNPGLWLLLTLMLAGNVEAGFSEELEELEKNAKELLDISDDEEASSTEKPSDKKKKKKNKKDKKNKKKKADKEKQKNKRKTTEAPPATTASENQDSTPQPAVTETSEDQSRQKQRVVPDPGEDSSSKRSRASNRTETQPAATEPVEKRSRQKQRVASDPVNNSSQEQAAAKKSVAIQPPVNPAPQKTWAIETGVNSEALNQDPKLVSQAERMLANFGYDLSADSVYDAETRSAIRQFERTIGAEPRGDITRELISRLMSSTKVAPQLLLFYKHAPEGFSDESMMAATRMQISTDQRGYKTIKNGFKLVADHVFMFSEKQVADRVASFAAEELLPEYRGNIASLARQVPDEFTFKTLKRLDYFVYQDGKLRAKKHPHGPEVLFSHVNPYLRQNSQNSEDRRVSIRYPSLSMPYPLLVPRSQQGMENSVKGRSVAFILDRDPMVPAIAMKRSAAEQLWKRTDCKEILGATFVEQNEGQENPEKNKKFQACVKTQQEYGNQITFAHRVRITGIESADKAWYVSARVQQLDVIGPTGQVLKTLNSGEFMSPPKIVQTSLEPEETSKTRAAENTRNLDILGVRLGMPLATAEASLKQRIKVKSVYKIDGVSSINTSVDAPYTRYFPYSRGRVYANGSLKDVVTLHVNEKNIVIGIARLLKADDLTEELFKASLVKKYGSPSDGLYWGSYGRSGACTGNGWLRDKKLRRIEGAEVPNIEFFGTSIGIRPDKKTTADALETCTPILKVSSKRLGGGKNGIEAEFRLFDHSQVSKGLRVLEKAQRDAQKKSSEGLKL